MTAPLLVIEHVSRRFETKPDLAGRLAARLRGLAARRTVHAVVDISLAIAEGEVLGLIGESGCGKSTLGRMVAGVIEPSEGLIAYRGQAYDGGSPSLRIQMIFQDPMSSLNPTMRVGNAIAEAPLVHGLVPRRAIDAYVESTMRRVGLDPSYASRYPHQFSGGQRQRVGIARALAVKPDLIVCDEPVAALDVSVQAQVLNLFMALRREFGLSYLFISHDLGVVEHITDRVAIMYLGRIVEVAPTEQLFQAPNHPYTQALLASVPRLDGQQDFRPIAGEVPSPINPPSGCAFHPRCPHAMARCRDTVPALRPIAPGRSAACHLNEQL